MKIVEIIPSLASGGAERFVVDLSNWLHRQNNDVYIIVLRSLTSESTAFYQKEVDSGIKIISLNKNRGLSFKAIFQMIRILMQINPDVVHSHLNSLFYISLPALFHLKKILFFHTIHNDADKDAGNWLYGLIMKVCFKSSIIKAITISKSSCDSFISYYGINPFALIYNGRAVNFVEVQDEAINIIKKLKRTENTKILLYVARLTEQKRPLLHAKICNKLYLKGHDIALLMIGEDRSNGFYLQKIKEMNSECVHVLGPVSNPIEFMKLSDAFVLLSSYEGLPIALIEALSVGCIPICTPVGGIKDIIKSDQNGFLSSDCSEAECYKTIEKFLNSKASYLELIRRESKNSYKPLSMDFCGKEYMSMFKKSIGTNKFS